MSDFLLSDIFPEGPRDWSPRLDWANGMIERIRKVIPKELLVEEGRVLGEGNLPSRWVGDIGLDSNSKRFKIVFLVKLGNNIGEVSLGEEGKVYMGFFVVQLLDGLIKGYEHLGKLNPFRNPE